MSTRYNRRKFGSLVLMFSTLLMFQRAHASEGGNVPTDDNTATSDCDKLNKELEKHDKFIAGLKKTHKLNKAGLKKQKNKVLSLIREQGDWEAALENAETPARKRGVKQQLRKTNRKLRIEQNVLNVGQRIIDEDESTLREAPQKRKMLIDKLKAHNCSWR